MKRTLFALALLPLPALAQSHADHGTHAAASMPSEAGQGGFAALAEITEMLRADPATDWSRVDLAPLRAHLRDMDLLVTELEVAAEVVPGGLRMTIAGEGPAVEAARRMVPAHGPVLAGETGWQSDVVEGEDLVWTVTDPSAEAQIRGLGFFGLMAVGNHHPAHHLAMATGGAH